MDTGPPRGVGGDRALEDLGSRIVHRRRVSSGLLGWTAGPRAQNAAPWGLNITRHAPRRSRGGLAGRRACHDQLEEAETDRDARCILGLPKACRLKDLAYSQGQRLSSLPDAWALAASRRAGSALLRMAAPWPSGRAWGSARLGPDPHVMLCSRHGAQVLHHLVVELWTAELGQGRALRSPA